ncbi:Cell division protein MraZ [hydrothermal vent metagenome]|uniref:Transcriptional regulator MraZ n=1 Tax=hydrothermal vent metagenome TaxID=652676 RepID=A0A3B1A0N4_9ZZZZ
MAISFRGTSELSLDAKGRLAMPVRYRETLADFCGGDMVVAIGYAREKYLLVYPRPHWEIYQETLDAWPTYDPDVQMVKRMILGSASDIKMDGNGRILLSPVLRRHAGLEKEVVLIGQNQKFELWNQSTWDETREAMTWSLELAQKLESFG